MSKAETNLLDVFKNRFAAYLDVPVSRVLTVFAPFRGPFGAVLDHYPGRKPSRFFMTILRAPLCVDQELLASWMDDVSIFGATEDGGVNRPALTKAHRDARAWFRDTVEARGYTVLIDRIGNLFAVLDQCGPDAPVVMIGSHLDSQPFGGRFDGAYGVVAALSVIEAWRSACRAENRPAQCNYVIADWMNEEGARFQPSLMGSSVYAGQIDLDWALNRQDRNGVRVEDALQRIGYDGDDRAPRADMYLELHIEGDTKMEDAGARIAPFVRYWGATKLRIQVTGEKNHTGPTPMEARKDALLGAAFIIAEVRHLSEIAQDTLYTSVARIDVSPNSPNIVPDKAILFAELRSPEPATLAWAETLLKERLPDLAAGANVTVEVVSIDRRNAGRFDSRLVALAERAADTLGFNRMQLDTICGHDAVAINEVMPSLVIAVPSKDGKIHSPDEFTSLDDLEAGAKVLAEMVRHIERAGGLLDETLAGAI